MLFTFDLVKEKKALLIQAITLRSLILSIVGRPETAESQVPAASVLAFGNAIRELSEVKLHFDLRFFSNTMRRAQPERQVGRLS